MVLARDYGRGSGDGGAWRGKKNAAQFSPRAGSLHAVDPAFIREMRERLRRSRAVFARRLRVNERTLEKWEEGRRRGGRSRIRGRLRCCCWFGLIRTTLKRLE
jgi:hypothetical protein